MLDLLAVGTQLLILLGQCLAVGLKLRYRRSAPILASASEVMGEAWKAWISWNLRRAWAQQATS